MCCKLFIVSPVKIQIIKLLEVNNSDSYEKLAASEVELNMLQLCK